MTVEIAVRETWDDSCTVLQARKQAIEGAEQALRLGLVIKGLISGRNADEKGKTPANIIGEPKVAVIIVVPEPHDGDDGSEDT